MLKCLIFTLSMILHPVHVSLTSIEHIPDTDSIKVFVRMYYDDFLSDYRLFDRDAGSEYLSGNQEIPENMMEKYLAGKVIITVNNKQLKGKLLNQQLALAENEISVNLVYQSDMQPEIVSVKNEIMTGLYNDQANMTIVRIGRFEEGVKLTPEKTEQTFILK